MSADFQPQTDSLFTGSILETPAVDSRGIIGSAATGLAVGGSLAGIAYEWSIGNEVATPAIAGRIAELAHGVGGTALTTIGTAAFVFSEQLASGIFTAVAVNRAPRLAAWLNRKLVKEEQEAKSWADLSLKDRFDYSIALGASFASAREKVVRPNSKIRDGIRQAANSAKIGAITVGTIAFVFDGSTRLAGNFERFEAVAEGADVTRDVIYDWRTWGLVFAGKFAYRGIKSVLGRRQEIRANPINEAE